MVEKDIMDLSCTEPEAVELRGQDSRGRIESDRGSNSIDSLTDGTFDVSLDDPNLQSRCCTRQTTGVDCADDQIPQWEISGRKEVGGCDSQS